jgi:hypothetical protein
VDKVLDRYERVLAEGRTGEVGASERAEREVLFLRRGS